MTPRPWNDPRTPTATRAIDLSDCCTIRVDYHAEHSGEGRLTDPDEWEVQIKNAILVLPDGSQWPLRNLLRSRMAFASKLESMVAEEIAAGESDVADEPFRSKQ